MSKTLSITKIAETLFNGYKLDTLSQFESFASKKEDHVWNTISDKLNELYGDFTRNHNAEAAGEIKDRLDYLETFTENPGFFAGIINWVWTTGWEIDNKYWLNGMGLPLAYTQYSNQGALHIDSQLFEDLVLFYYHGKEDNLSIENYDARLSSKYHSMLKNLGELGWLNRDYFENTIKKTKSISELAEKVSKERARLQGETAEDSFFSNKKIDIPHKIKEEIWQKTLEHNKMEFVEARESFYKSLADSKLFNDDEIDSLLYWPTCDVGEMNGTANALFQIIKSKQYDNLSKEFIKNTVNALKESDSVPGFLKGYVVVAEATSPSFSLEIYGSMEKIDRLHAETENEYIRIYNSGAGKILESALREIRQTGEKKLDYIRNKPHGLPKKMLDMIESGYEFTQKRAKELVDQYHNLINLKPEAVTVHLNNF